jgi:hypothetical protein
MKIFRDILSHLATFLISLLLAILIWAGASQQNNPMMLQSLQIPLNLVGQPENSTLEVSTENVIVVVEAPSSVLSELSSDDFSATID